MTEDKASDYWAKKTHSMINNVGSKINNAGCTDTVTISVCTSDIKNSIPCGIGNPVARALERYLSGQWFVWGGEHAYEMQMPYRSIVLPHCVSIEMEHYMASGIMRPFEFYINL